MLENNPESKRNTTWKQIYKRFKDKVEKMNTQYSNQGIKGEENEKALINFLIAFLPKRFKIEQRGVLLDKNGSESTEQDIIIWDSMNYPRIFYEDRYFPIESVLACIEVKTTLNDKELKKSIVNIRDLRRMNYFKRVISDPQWQIHPPLCFLFSYNTIWKKFGTILHNIESIITEYDIKSSERFDYMYIMRKGLIINWDLPHDSNFKGIVNFNKRYGNILPFNKRWPQFLPSKLIKELPLILYVNQVSQNNMNSREAKKLNKGFFIDLTVESQILGMLDFLTNLCQALEDQKIFPAHRIISGSYSKNIRGTGGRCSINPF